jgi:O-antigen polysaccharide polymerase Wzy
VPNLEDWFSLILGNPLAKSPKLISMLKKNLVDNWLTQVIITGIILFLFRGFSELVGLSDFRSFLVTLSFLVNGILAGVFLAQAFSQDKISIRAIFFFFNFVFFFLVPIAQYSLEKWMFLKSDNKNILFANVLITFWMILFLFGYQLISDKVGRNKHILVPNQGKFVYGINNNRAMLAVGFILALSGFFIAVSGINALLLRSEGGIVRALGGWGPLGLIGQYYSRPLPLFMLLFSIFYNRKKGNKRLTGYFYALLTFLPAGLLNFPTSTARFYAFTIYLGVFTIFTRRLKFVNSYVYLALMTFGIFGSSWINFARSGDFSQFGGLSFDTQFLFEGNFDAYENFVHTIGYVDLNGNDFGRQLLGVILFWLPRAAWSDKPVGTGVFLAEYLNKTYKVENENISAPLIEELYLAFGIAAVVVGGFAVGALAAWLDRNYQIRTKTASLTQSEPVFMLLYPFLIGLSLFIQRGDALSSIAYTCGISAAYASLRCFLLEKQPLPAKIILHDRIVSQRSDS